jgi:hypothetical protein
MTEVDDCIELTATRGDLSFEPAILKHRRTPSMVAPSMLAG